MRASRLASPSSVAGRVLVRAAALSMAVLLAAHVNSPGVFYSGAAGPYAIDVAVTPPGVVPGVAEVLVHVRSGGVSRVVVRPVFWRAGSKGAPAGDDATRVRGDTSTYVARVWLMASGAYAVDVSVSGKSGTGSVLVPVEAVATGQLALSPFLRVLLIVLGTLLVAGILTAIHAAVGESQVPPGEAMPTERRNRARLVTLATMPAVAFILFGGANWWQSEAARYRRTLIKPVKVTSAVTDSAGVPTLSLRITEKDWLQNTPLMPDHGKMAHLFVVRADSPYVFAHLHPEMPTRTLFTTPLPPLPAGRYRVFADVVHESGFESTLVDSLVIPRPLGVGGVPHLTPDDSWTGMAGDGTVRSAVSEREFGILHDDEQHVIRVGAYSAILGHEGGVYVRWAGPPRVRVNQPGVVRIGLTDIKGNAATIEPYLGMMAHAAVMRNDGKVFIHLHPSGTVSMASQMAFAMRDRGDTTAKGRLALAQMDMPSAIAAQDTVREIDFPYAFPQPGPYQVWVQIRSKGTVHTTQFALTVEP